MHVAVILVNYRQYAEQYLASCYASLIQQSFPQEQTSLFIVDNATTPETQSFIAHTAPTARLLLSRMNIGWAGGNNLAIREALEEGVDSVVLLNMDTVLDRDWLSALVSTAQARADLHILQSKILLHDDHRIHSLGNRIHYLGYGYCLGYGQPEDAVEMREPMDFASGASMLVKREVFERIGLLRDDYFMYYDDLEFCWRARLAGFQVGLAEQSVCYHKYAFANALSLLYYLQRNRLMTLLTLERIGTLMVIFPCLLVAELVVGAYLTAQGKGMTALRVWGYFLKPSTWVSIWRHRRAVHHLRRMPDQAIVRQFAWRIVFAEVHPQLFRLVANPLLALYWTIVKRLIIR